MIAEEIASSLRADIENFTQVNVIGGYVNLSCTARVWMDILSQVENQQQEKKNETIVVDYIGMNVGKPPHIGHICTPLQGQSIINVLKYHGYHVISDSHLGDWGLLFGKLIIGFEKYGSQEKLREDAINHLLEVYIAINTDTESDPSIEQFCRDAFRELSNGKKEYTDLWVQFTTASIATNKKILELMHIHQDYDIGESFYE
jgi:arginyl-tRNA synthetase